MESKLGNNVEDWKNLKFGMFIHWGLYSILGEGEWAMFRKPIDKDEYRGLANQFTATKFNAEKWAEAAKSAGMKYMVFTARHHDGFALFDSNASFEDFTSVQSVAKRDFVAEYTDACRRAGLGVGIYYSPLDWRMPGFFFPKMYKKSAGLLVEQCHKQVNELLSNYGKVDILWFDGGEDFWLCHGMDLHKDDLSISDRGEKVQVENFWEADKLDLMARTLQPGIVINNRTGMRQFGDFLTPEGRVGEFNLDTPWETCDTLTGSWGWMPDAQMKSLRECIQLLVKVVTGGGNLLLNVGPRADGSIEDKHLQRLQEIGNWMDLYGESIYGTRGGPILNGSWGGATWKENKLFVHVIDWKQDEVKLRVGDAKILNIDSLTSSKVIVNKRDDTIGFTVPAEDRQAIDTIFVIEFDENVDEAFKGTNPYSLTQGRTVISNALIV